VRALQLVSEGLTYQQVADELGYANKGTVHHLVQQEGSRSSARTWLMMLTHRRAVDRVRYEQRRPASALGEKDDYPDDRPGPEVQAITALLGERAVSALALLTANKREALVLAYWGGYTQREIAVMTSTPLGTVKTRTRNALIQLHQSLADGTQPAA